MPMYVILGQNFEHMLCILAALVDKIGRKVCTFFLALNCTSPSNISHRFVLRFLHFVFLCISGAPHMCAAIDKVEGGRVHGCFM